VDSPDRHSGDPADWLPRLEELAYDAGRPLAVVATVAAVPAGWTGPVTAIGNAAPAVEAAEGAEQPEDPQTPFPAGDPAAAPAPAEHSVESEDIR